MIRAYRLEDGELTTETGLAAVILPEGECRIWFDVVAPDEEERKVLADTLGLHELALAAALRERTPPKLEDYGDHLFVIAHTPVAGERQPTRKIAIFLGRTWVLSASVVPLAPVDAAERRILAEPERFLCRPERVAHALLDEMINGFESLFDDLLDRVEALECAASDRAEKSCLVALQESRREAARYLQVVRAQRDVCMSLSRINHEVLSQQITPYLRDAYDHCLRLYETLEHIRDALAAARDGYLSAVNNRLGDTMRVLTVIATVMMPLSVVVGVFGMNFDHIPFLHHPLGFWATLAIMGGMAAGMLHWFHRRGWI